MATWSELPLDIWLQAACHLDVENLGSLAAVSHPLQRVAVDRQAWRRIFLEEHEAVIRVLFDGRVPDPPCGVSWRHHYLKFSSTWLSLAQERSERILLRMSTECVDHCERWSWWRRSPAPRTFAVYDVTSYAPRHPGAETLLLDAATQEDATDLFGLGRHSAYARRLLQSLAVPGLEAVPYGQGLVRLRRPRVRQPLLPRPRAVGVFLVQAAVIAGLSSGAHALSPRLIYVCMVLLPWAVAIVISCRTPKQSSSAGRT